VTEVSSGIVIIVAMYFTSTERVLPAHIISLLRGFFVIIPMAFILSALAGMTGVWLAFPTTELLVTAAGIILFIRHR
ncbi:MAG: MATE family efflux transporter, partial [Planctomycetia bacterium]|nr:MATE family efflux transporter [Planctomycetia bacterium]